MKKKNIISFFFKMFILTFLVLLISDLIPVFFAKAILSKKYGFEFIAELFMVAMIIAILFISKDEFLFTQKKEKFFSSIKKAWVILFMGGIIFLANATTLNKVNIGAICNLAFYCTMIGLFEEFLCRGWIQNEFLKRFGEDEKKAKLSIFCASLLFGAIHFTNILAGQNFLETLLQVLQATSSGFLFGALYYKTGNIWSTVFLHGFYDFAIMLGESGDFVDCITLSNPSFANLLLGYISSFIIIGLYMTNGLKILNVKENDNKKARKYNIVLIVLIVLLLFPSKIEGTEDYTVCYKFDDYKITNSYEIRYSNKETYQIKYIEDDEEKYLNLFLSKDSNLMIENPATGKINKISESTYDFILVEQNDSYVLLINQFNLTKNKTIYLEIDKKTINSTDEYLNSLLNKKIEIVVPEIEKMGYVYINDGEQIYPIIETGLDEIFIIRDKDSINLLVD